MINKVFISTYTFCRFDESALHLLKQAGIKPIINPLSRELKADEVARLASDCDRIIAGTEDLSLLIHPARN